MSGLAVGVLLKNIQGIEFNLSDAPWPPKMEPSLMQRCVHVAADNAARLGKSSMEALPLPMQTMISECLSAETLNDWHEMLQKRGVPMHRTWQKHLIGRWPIKFKHEDLFLQKPWTLKEPRQLYLQNHFHSLFRCATVDPTGLAANSFSTPLHRLSRMTSPSPPPPALKNLLLSLAPFVEELCISVSFSELKYLRENPALLEALVKSTRSLVVYHLNISRYSDARSLILEEFIVKGKVEALSLEHCVLDEPEWKDLVTVCNGSALPGGYSATVVTSTKRKYEVDATLSSATKRLRRTSSSSVDSPSSTESSEDEGSLSVVVADALRASSRRALKAFHVYVTHSYDFSRILGEALRDWTSLEKIEIWQRDAYSFKMILPNEINKKVRSGQIMHRTISGCLAVAGQLPLFLEALLIRHGNGAEPMDHVELEGSYIWAGSQPLRNFRDVDNFHGCKSLVLRESTIADDTCELLGAMFETDRALRSVRLHEVKLGIVMSYVDRILQTLAMRGQLEILELVKVNCTDSCQILPSVIARLPNLRQLILKECELSFDEESFKEFSHQITHHPTLEVLVLSDNVLRSLSCDLLVDLFTKAKPFPSLKMLDVQLTGVKGTDLSDAVRKIKQHLKARDADRSPPWKLSFLNLGGSILGGEENFKTLLREFEHITDIVHLWDSGRMGAEHVSQM